MSDRTPRLVAAALAVLAVGGGVAFLALRGGDSKQPQAGEPGDSTSARAGGAGTTTGRAGGGGPAFVDPSHPAQLVGGAGSPSGSPATPSGGTGQPQGTAGGSADPGADDPLAGDRPPVRTYVMEDGTVGRDHRRGPASAPVAIVPTPPEQRTMSSDLTARVYREVAPKVAACSAKVPDAALGADPFVYLNLTVDVTGGRLNAASVLPVAHDIEEAAATALVTCTREALAKLSLDAAGEPERTGYVLQYPLRVRTPR